jgi:hypothetical protein
MMKQALTSSRRNHSVEHFDSRQDLEHQPEVIDPELEQLRL